jgi:hypothetical protein
MPAKRPAERSDIKNVLSVEFQEKGEIILSTDS